MRTLLWMLLWILWPVLAGAATYYVDGPGGSGPGGSDGNSCSAAQDPSSARATLNAGVSCMAGGDTLFLRGGDYSGQHLGFHSGIDIPNGTALSPTVFASFPGEIATINTAKFVNNDAFMLLDRIKMVGQLYLDPSASNVRFQNGEIVGRIDMFESAVAGFGAFLTIINSTIRGAAGPGGSDPSIQSYGMYWSGTDSLFDNNDWYHHPGYAIHIFLSASDTVSRNVVRNSRIHTNAFNQAQGAFIISSGHDNIAYNNIVYNNRGTGLIVEGRDNIAYNNTVYGNQNMGIQTGEFNNTQRPIIRNNISYANNGVDIQDFGAMNPLITHNHTGADGDPRFVNPSGGNFQLQASSPARNTGVTIGLFNTDQVGVTRPQGASWDKGAFEFVEGGGTGPLPNGNDIYLSAGGHGDSPSDGDGSVQSCINAENITTPKATLPGALACMSVPGKVLRIRAGTYGGLIDTMLTPIAGGTSWATATRIEAHQAESVTITLPSGATQHSFRSGTSYLILDKLKFDCLDRTNSTCMTFLPGAHHIRVQNGEITNAWFDLVFINEASSIELLNNTLWGSDHGAGCVHIFGSQSETKIHSNHIHTCATQGIVANTGFGTNTNLVVSSNRISNTGVGGANVALDLGSSVGAMLQNNLLYDNTGIGIRIRTGAQGTKLYNNTVASNTGVGIQCDTGATGVQMTNNLSFGNGTDAIGGACSPTLTTNKTTNPLFTNVALDDYTLLPTSTAINAGTTLVEVPVAIDGTPRPQGIAYDIGAYERDAPPPTIDPTLKHRVPVYIQSWFH